MTNSGVQDVDTPSSRALVLEASEQAMVLLKNSPASGGTAGLLPLQPDQTVAVIGPLLNATEQMLSIYYGEMTPVSR